MRTLAQKQNQPQKRVSSSLARSNTATSGPTLHSHPLPHLQRTIGNQAVLRMLQTDVEKPEAGLTGTASPHFGHDFSRIPIHPPTRGAIQTKLAIDKSGDEYEREADLVSEQVMRISEPQLQRVCSCGGGCPKCQTNQTSQKHERLQTSRVGSSGGGETAVAPIVHEVLRSPGQPMDPASRAFMEPRFGHDFSRVRVHAGELAAESADQIQARAYTVGQHVVFGEGQYAPNTPPGLELIAHELTHVLQQGATGESGVLQRQAAPNAKRWTGASAACGAYFCLPFLTEAEAKFDRATNWWLYKLGIAYEVSSRVLGLWDLWADGGSSSVLNLTNDFGADFSASPTTLDTTTFLMDRIKAKLTANPPTTWPAARLSIDIPALIPADVKAIGDPNSPHKMGFNVSGDIPANLAGGIGKDQAATPIGATPSSQDDERIAKGSVEIVDAGANMLVLNDLSYTVKDTIDLCPGNCGGTLAQQATIPMSRWEATGISGDVPFIVDFPAPALASMPFIIPKPAAPKAPPSVPAPAPIKP
jgi:hypothetical protein